MTCVDTFVIYLTGIGLVLGGMFIGWVLSVILGIPKE